MAQYFIFFNLIFITSITFPLEGFKCVFLLQVFKVLVRKTPDESWVVFRRYTDFSRLNDKVCFGVCVFFLKCTLLRNEQQL